MGGAERANRKRRQEATRAGTAPGQGAPGTGRGGSAGTAGAGRGATGGAKTAGAGRGATGGAKTVGAARAAAGGQDNRTRVITAVVVVVLLAAAILGGVLWQRSRSAPPAATPHQVTAPYPTQTDGTVVTAGSDTAKVTIDVYEDFLCPACGAFEKRDSGKIEQALTAGTLRVRYHVLNLLDDRSNPAGYSLDAANAALCAADAGAFPSYHASLFASQPQEGGRGHSIDQLIQLGHDLGIPAGTFDTCVRDGTHRNAVVLQLQTAMTDKSLQRPGPGGGSYFGTPTVVLNGTVVDLGDASWLDNALKSAAS